MYSIGATCNCNIHARVDEQPSSFIFLTGIRTFSNNLHCSSSQRLQFTATKILLAELNKIDSTRGSLPDFIEQGSPTGCLIAGELLAIGNVIEQQSATKFVPRGWFWQS